MGKGPLQWTDDLLTGDIEIDGHHKSFYRKALRVHVACNLGRGEEFLAETFRFLRDYAKYHFAAEETRMRAAQYPHIESHLEAHQGFVDKLAQLERDLEAAQDKQTVARSAAEVAIQWFNRHIKLVDRPLVEYLRQNAVDG